MASYRDTVLADNPLAYLRLDETSGTTLSDETGNGHSGSIQGTYALGQTALITEGNSVDLSDGDIRITGGAWAPSNGAERSYEIWINPETLGPGGGRFFSVGAGGVTNGDTIELSVEDDGSGNWVILYRYFGGNREFGPISQTNPSHIVFVVPSGATDHNDPYIILNGVIDNGTTGTALTLDDTASDIVIGRTIYDSTIPFHGFVDEIAIYGVALSQARAEAHYNSGISATYTISGSIEGVSSGSAIAATISAYRELDWSLSATKTLDGVQTTYTLDVVSGEHTVIAVPPQDSGLPAKIFYNVVPIQS